MKLVREHIINEKFTDESDPIKDMGIGIFKHNIEIKNSKQFYRILITLLPQITTDTSIIPDDIIQNGGLINWKYFYLIQAYINQYFIFSKNTDDLHWKWIKALRKKLIKMGYKIKSND